MCVLICMLLLCMKNMVKSKSYAYIHSCTIKIKISDINSYKNMLFTITTISRAGWLIDSIFAKLGKIKLNSLEPRV